MAFLFFPLRDIGALSADWHEILHRDDDLITPIKTFGGPCLAFGVGRLLHLPSAEAISVRPNARPQK